MRYLRMLQCGMATATGKHVLSGARTMWCGWGGGRHTLRLKIKTELQAACRKQDRA